MVTNVFNSQGGVCSWAPGGIEMDAALAHRVDVACSGCASMDASLSSSAPLELSPHAALSSVDSGDVHLGVLTAGVLNSLSHGQGASQPPHTGVGDLHSGDGGVGQRCVLQDPDPQEGAQARLNSSSGISSTILLIENAWQHRDLLLAKGPGSCLEQMQPGTRVALLALVKRQTEVVYFGLLGHGDGGGQPPLLALAADGSNLVAFHASQKAAKERGCGVAITRAFDAIANFQKRHILRVGGGDGMRTLGGLSVYLCSIHIQCMAAASQDGSVSYTVNCSRLEDQHLVPSIGVERGGALGLDAGLAQAGRLEASGSAGGAAAAAVILKRPKRERVAVNYAALSNVSWCGEGGAGGGYVGGKGVGVVS